MTPMPPRLMPRAPAIHPLDSNDSAARSSDQRSTDARHPCTGRAPEAVGGLEGAALAPPKHQWAPANR
jgi:hypothetical protein